MRYMDIFGFQIAIFGAHLSGNPARPFYAELFTRQSISASPYASTYPLETEASSGNLHISTRLAPLSQESLSRYIAICTFHVYFCLCDDIDNYYLTNLFNVG